jgi:thioredoxin
MAIARCAQCGAKNRVDERREGVTPVCGRCGAELPPASATPVEVTDTTFAEVVLGAGATPVLLDCWAPWCGPCRALTPIIDALAAEAAGRYTVGKLNIDENPRVTNQFQIRSIPTLLIFRNGQLVDTLMGVQPKQVIAARLAAHQ